MIPWQYHQLAREIHEERIKSALARRPEWSPLPAPLPSARARLAQPLRWLAAALIAAANAVE